MEKDGSAAGAGTTGEAKPVVPAVEEKRPADVVDDVPDPDEDDLDDLDGTFVKQAWGSQHFMR